MGTMKNATHHLITIIATGLFTFSGHIAYAVDPCSQVSQLSGGTIITENKVGSTGTGYEYELWTDGTGANGTLISYPKDACFKASWDHSGSILACEGKSFNQAKLNDLGGDLQINYAFEKTEEEHANYAFIGLEGWMNNAQIEWIIVEDCVNDNDTVYVSDYQKEVGETFVDGSVYKVWTRRTPVGIDGRSTYYIFSVRQSRRQCGTVNLSEHFRQWSKIGVDINYDRELLDNANITVDVFNGKGSVTFTHASMEIVSSTDTIPVGTIGQTDTIPDIDINPDTIVDDDTVVIIPQIDPCSMVEKYSGDRKLVMSQVVKMDNGFFYELWTDDNMDGSITAFGGDAACAFKANWDNSGDFLAHSGCYIFSKNKKYDEYGAIVAGYNYTKSGDGGESSYIGLYGWLYNPSIEYYIVDDSYGDLSAPQNAEKLGTYEMDDDTYTLYKEDYIVEDGMGKTSIMRVFAVRSSARTCGVVSVDGHFKEWADLGLTLGEIYSCTIGCEVFGGSGSIEYSYANVFMGGQRASENASDSVEIRGVDALRSIPSTITSSESISSNGADIVLSPNPADNFFKVESAQAISSIEILDFLGCTLYRQEGGETVDVNLPAGAYLVKVVTVDGNTSVQKLMVK